MLKELNKRIKKLTVIDIGLTKWSVLFATIILVKIFPQILRIHYSVLIILLVLCSVKPIYDFWFKK
ncbi:MAG: hypothetical protein PHI58_06140 [Candidatus Omnitrophica bacterium]|nr:hypothetical protein [Candidatus Omnitrophota bacterium]